MSNSLDPDQARHYVGPDLGPHCLQRLSADDNSKQRIIVILKCLDKAELRLGCTHLNMNEKQPRLNTMDYGGDLSMVTKGSRRRKT